jgi:hypothetical protein
VPRLGSFPDDWAVQIYMVDKLRRFPNLYADTGGVRSFELLIRAVRAAGPRKLVFGSDGLYLHRAVQLFKVRMLHLPPGDEARVAGGTLRNLFGLPRPGEADRSVSRPVVVPPPSRREEPVVQVPS